MWAERLKAGKMVLSILLILVVAWLAYVLINPKVYQTESFEREAIFDGAPATSEFAGDYLSTSAEITVVAIHSGDLNVMLSNPVNLSHPAFAGVEDKMTTVPVYMYLIRHEKFGCFLIDSGCCASYAENPFGTMSGLAVSRFVPRTQLDPEDAIEVQLDDTLQNIKGMFFTHLHFDHTSGVPALPEDILFFAGKGETYLINTPDHSIFIAGDAITTNDCLEYGVRSGTSSSNRKKDQQTIEKLKAYLDEHPEIEVWCGHDDPTAR